MQRLDEIGRRGPAELAELLQVWQLIIGQPCEVVGDIGALLHRHDAKASALIRASSDASRATRSPTRGDLSRLPGYSKIRMDE